MSENQSWFESGNPRLMFVFGLVTGIAAVSLLVSGSLLTSSGGFRIAQADAVERPEGVGGGDPTTAPAVENEGNDAPTPVVAPPQPVVKADVPAIESTDHVRGSKDAKVVLVEYSDFQCPYCGRHHPNMLKLVEEYGDQVAWVYRHFPLSFHEEAEPSAIASECASEQGKFWEFADAMFENQSDLGDDLYEATAKELGLNMDQFNTCLDSGKYDDLIASQMADGSSAGVSGTPATFVNGELVSGAVPYSTLKSMVEKALAE